MLELLLPSWEGDFPRSKNGICRSKSRSEFCLSLGDGAPDCDRLNYDFCIGSTTSVCTYATGNTLQGLCDMAGNVWEWVADADVIRGGSYDNGLEFVSSRFRYSLNTEQRLNMVGFRLARDLPQ